MTPKGGRLDGRNRGINVWYRDGACGIHAFVDYPPPVKDGWVRFELARVR